MYVLSVREVRAVLQRNRLNNVCMSIRINALHAQIYARRLFLQRNSRESKVVEVIHKVFDLHVCFVHLKIVTLECFSSFTNCLKWDVFREWVLEKICPHQGTGYEVRLTHVP